MMETQQIGYTKSPTNHKDIFFIETLIDTISSEYNIDLNRIYACGYSLGGMFSYELACQLNNKITDVSVGKPFMDIFKRDIIHPTGCSKHKWNAMEYTHTMTKMDGIFRCFKIVSAYSNNTDIIPITTQLPDLNTSDGVLLKGIHGKWRWMCLLKN